MRFWKFSTLLFLLIFLGYYYIVLIIREEENEMIFSGFILGFIFLLFLIICFISFRTESRLYKKSNSFNSFRLTFCSIGIFIFAIATHLFLFYRDSAPLYLKAGQDLDFNFIHLELREDNTYKFTNGSALGNSYSRGKYVRNDSIITIDTVGSDKLLKSNKLAIREDKIFMIDAEHKIIDSLFYFNLYK